MQELQIGRVYRHFKGDYYLVEGLAHDSESGVPCVIYRKLYGDGGLWVRPLEMFLSRVDSLGAVPGLLGQNPHLDPGGYHTGKFPAVLPQV